MIAVVIAWAVTSVVVSAIWALVLYVREDRFERREREWAEERANLINAAKGARMAPPSRLQKPSQDAPDEPKDLKEYAAIGTISAPADD